jgi:hypothetical protein
MSTTATRNIAATWEDAGFARREIKVSCVAGIHAVINGETGNPETVCDVCRCQSEVDELAFGHIQN